MTAKTSGHFWDLLSGVFALDSETFRQIALLPEAEVLNPDIKLHIKSDQRAWE